jgi:hypothetical protein
MSRTKIQAEILQTIRTFGHCVLTARMLMIGFTDDAEFTAFKTKHKLASTYDKASGQTTFRRMA